MSKKLYSFFILLTAFLWLGSGTMWGDDLTLTLMGDDTSTQKMPVDGYNLDGAQHNQLLFLSSELSAMNGGTIKGLKFYFNRTGHSWYNANNIPTMTVRLIEVSNTSLSSQVAVDGATLVYSGAVNLDFTNKLFTVTFDNAYSYGGGNLLIDFQTAAGSYVRTSSGNYLKFYASAVSGRAMFSSTAVSACPKTTFTYEEAAVVGGCNKPKNLGISAELPDGATFTWEQNVDETTYQWACVTSGASVEVWNTLDANVRTKTVTGLTAGTAYDFCVRSYCGSGESEQSELVKKTFTPECPAPTYPSTPVTAKTATTATIAWNAVDGMTKYQYVCVAKNAPPSWTSPSETTGTSANIEGLTAYTEYDFYVRSWYSATAISEAVKTTFRTECAAVNAPHTWDFEDATAGAVPGCWDNSGSTSSTINSDPSYIWGVYNYYSTGNKMLRLNNLMVKKDGTALINSPSIVLPAAPAAYELAFEYCHKASCGAFTVKVSEDGGATWVEKGSYANETGSNSTSPTDFIEADIDLTSYAGKTIMLQFCVNADYSQGAIFVDNVEIREKSSCPAPKKVLVSNILDHSASVAWTEKGEATAWKLQTSTNGTDWSAEIDANANPFTLTGLTESTTYYVRVAASCSTTETSDWSDKSAAFTTKCEAATLPFTEGFESALSSCWEKDAKWASYAYSSGHESSTSMRYVTGANADLKLPLIAIDDDAQISFWHLNTSLGFSVYINSVATENKLGDFSTSSSWKKDSINLSAYKNQKVILIFHATTASGTKYIYLDDISVDYVPVAKPTNLAAEATADGANVTWNSTEGTSWNLQYREKDAEPEAEWIAINGLTAKSRTLTGLSTEKTYEVQVQAVCSANRKSNWTASATFSPESCASVETVTYGAQTYNSIVVNWTTSGAGTWDIHYKAAGDANWTSAGTGLNEATKTLTGLSTGVAYTVEVKASCGEAWVAGEEFTLAYSKPASASVTGATDATASASWSTVADAESYQYVVLASGEPNWDSATPVAENSASLSGLNAGTAYTLYVRSVYSTGYSEAVTANFSTITIAPQNLQQDGESTTNSATFTWEANGAATHYQWSTDNSTWSEPITALTATAESLNSGSDYTFYVRSYYAENVYSTAISLPFHTQCATKSLGWSENFDNASALPACWESTNFGSGNNKWNIGSSWYEYKSASNSARFYAYKNSASATSDLITPAIELTEPSILKFFYLKSSSDVVAQVLIRISGEEDEVISTLSNKTSWGTTAEVIDMSSYVGKTAKLIFRAYGSTSNTTRYFYLDDVSVEAKPCPQLQNLAAVPTPDGAEISWEQGDDENRYQYCVVDEGEAADGWILLDENEFSVTISGKTFGNTYDCYVRSYCSATNQSEPLMVQFTPACVAPSALAISAVTDESATLSWTSNAKALRYKAESEDWTNETLDPIATSYDFNSLAGSTTYTVQVQAFCAADESEFWSDEFEFTTKCAARDAAELPLNEDFTAGVPACWESGTEIALSVVSEKLNFMGADEQIAILPKYNIELNKLSVLMDYTTGANIELGYYTSLTAAYQTLGDISDDIELDLASVAPASVGYLAIRYFNGTGITQANINSIRVRKTPSCLAPTALVATPSVGGASISWTAGSETAWNLQYKLASAASWTDAEGTITNPFVLSGLEQGVSYKVRVQAACAGEELSDWSDEAEFTTNCEDVAALPFIETFDAALSNCWDITDEETATYAHSVYGSELRLPGGKATSGHLVKLPNITASLTNAVMTIEYKATTGANTAVPQVGYIDDLGDFQELAALTKSNTTTEARVVLATANGKRLALRYDDGTSEGNFDIAEIRILEQLTLADNVDNTATLAALNGQTVDVTIGRTFVCADYFNTICLPFSLSAEELAASPIASNDLWAFKYARVEGGELLIRIVEAESINAGEPYLISWPEGDNIENPLFKNVTISASVGKVMGNENLKFVGTLKPETFAANHDDSKLFLYQNNTLYWWDGTYESALKSFRAFFTVEGGAGEMPIKNLPARIIKEEQETTGIDNTGVDAQALKLLENGCVVIIRNGVKYNIQGQVIEK